MAHRIIVPAFRRRQMTGGGEADAIRVNFKISGGYHMNHAILLHVEELESVVVPRVIWMINEAIADTQGNGGNGQVYQP